MSSSVSSMLFPESNLRLYVSSSLAEIIRLLEGFNGDQNDFDYVLYKMEQLVQVAIRSEEQGLWERVFSDQLLNTLIDVYNQLLEQDVHSFSERSSSAVINTGSVGRPALDIPKETLKINLQYGFSLIKIAEMFGVSRKTVSRRIRHYGLLEEIPRYTACRMKTLTLLFLLYTQNFLTVGYVG